MHDERFVLIYFISGVLNRDRVICSLLTELCVAELEEVTGESCGVRSLNGGLGLGLGFSQPVVQESSHPYTDDVTLTGTTTTDYNGKGFTVVCFYIC